MKNMYKLSMKSSPEQQQQQQQQQREKQSSSPTVAKNDETDNKQDNDDTNNEEEEDDAYDYDNNNNGMSSSVPSGRIEPSLPQNKFFGNKNASGRMMASSNNNNNSSSSSSKNVLKSLPPLFLYMETGDFRRAAERAKNHPREVRTWASIKVKSSTTVGQSMTTTKRLAIHQACFKVRKLLLCRCFCCCCCFRVYL